MSLLGNTYSINAENVEGQETDTLGGSVFESDMYTMEIKMAYLTESAKGALAMVIELADDKGRSIRKTEYFTNRAKENFYMKDGKKMFMPGFLKLNSLCELVLGKGFVESEGDFEDRLVNVYNADAKREVPTTVPVLVPLLKEKVRVGIIKKRENKNVKDQATDQYVPTNEETIFNEFDKWFHADTGQTSSEFKDGVEASFFEKWLARNQGKMIDKYKPVEKGPSAPGQRTASAGAVPSGEKKSLFNNK